MEAFRRLFVQDNLAFVTTKTDDDSHSSELTYDSSSQDEWTSNYDSFTTASTTFSTVSSSGSKSATILFDYLPQDDSSSTICQTFSTQTTVTASTKQTAITTCTREFQVDRYTPAERQPKVRVRKYTVMLQQSRASPRGAGEASGNEQLDTSEEPTITSTKNDETNNGCDLPSSDAKYFRFVVTAIQTLFKAIH
jgi:hypothetical protein